MIAAGEKFWTNGVYVLATGPEAYVHELEAASADPDVGVLVKTGDRYHVIRWEDVYQTKESASLAAAKELQDQLLKLIAKFEKKIDQLKNCLSA